MFEKFTDDARQAIVQAQEEARNLQHNYIGTEHLLLGVLTPAGDQNIARRILQTYGVTIESARRAVAGAVEPAPQTVSGHIPFTPRAKTVLDRAAAESVTLKHRHIGTAHILLGIVDEGGGLAAQILFDTGIDAAELRAAVLTQITAEDGAASPDVHGTPALSQVLQRAAEIADGRPIGSHHLLQALASAPDSAAGRALAELGVRPDALSESLSKIELDTTSDVTPRQLALSRTRIELDGDEAHLVFVDADIVDRARRIVALNGGEPVHGRDRLGGAFAGLYDAAEANLRLIELILGRDKTGPATDQAG